MAWRVADECFEECSCDTPIARCIVGGYDDASSGLSFDNTGKNGQYCGLARQA
jgi:hypothetical protein